MASRRNNSEIVETFRQEALNLAEKAIEQDTQGNFEAAKRLYQEVVRVSKIFAEH